MPAESDSATSGTNQESFLITCDVFLYVINKKSFFIAHFGTKIIDMVGGVFYI